MKTIKHTKQLIDSNEDDMHVKTKAICKCGHKFNEHRADLKECYVHKKIKGSTYQCTCRGFIGELKERIEG